jgi:predicted flap endonuclease-1-like 5' DNA nuclease
MSGSWACWFWTLVGAGCLGWGIKGMVLGPVMDEKRRELDRLRSKVTMLANQPPEVRTIEKRVEVPVERVVVKHVEVPVERIIEKRVEVPIEKTVEKVVDRPVDNQEYLVRIKALEGEVAMIAGLLPQIAQFQTVASQVGGRSIEGRVVVPVDNPEHLARIKAVEEEIVVIAGFLAQIAQAQTASSQAGVKSIEDRVVVPADNPEHLARIKALEGEVAVISDLRAQMAELRDLLLQVGEKVAEQRIETPTEQNRNVPIEQVSEQAVDLNQAGAVEPLDGEKTDQKSPDDLKHIRGVGPSLERFLHKRGVFWFSQVATWSQADIDKFEFLLPNFGGRIQRENWVRSAQVEHYKKYQEWLGDGEPPSESLDLSGQTTELKTAASQAEEKVAETSTEEIVLRNGAVVGETISQPVGDLGQTAAESVDEGEAVGASPDDLKRIRGVGPALERFLHKRGVFWFRQVATWSQADIDKFEFLLPNFGGRIQRENWVHSAQVEHYKRYKQWLGNGEPPSESLDIPGQMTEIQAASSQAGETAVEAGIETVSEMQGEVLFEPISEPVGALDQASAVEQVDEGETDKKSPDDLKHIRGVGPTLEQFLHKRGVFWFSQVATWKQTDIDKFEFLLPNFEGRIQRENWVRSAKVEHYKKYKQWLGDGEPPSTTPEIH